MEARCTSISLHQQAPQYSVVRSQLTAMAEMLPASQGPSLRGYQDP